MCLCQQSFKSKCTEYNNSLEEIPQPAHNDAEIKDVYGSLLDDLNAKYERLLSLFQTLLDNTKDIEADREVSHFKMLFARLYVIRAVMVDGRKTSLESEFTRN